MPEWASVLSKKTNFYHSYMFCNQALLLLINVVIIISMELNLVIFGCEML